MELSLLLISNDLQERKSLAIHAGVVPLKKICDHFQEMVETKHMETELNRQNLEFAAHSNAYILALVLFNYLTRLYLKRMKQTK